MKEYEAGKAYVSTCLGNTIGFFAARLYTQHIGFEGLVEALTVNCSLTAYMLISRVAATPFRILVSALL